MSFVKIWFANLKLQYKLMLSMAGVTTLALLAIIITTYQNYLSMNLAAEKEKSVQAVIRGSNSLASTLSSLNLKTSRMLLDSTIKDLVLQMEMDDMDRYADNFQSVTSVLDNYVEGTDVLISTFLLTPSFQYGIRTAGREQNPFDIITNSIWVLDTITYLPYDYNTKTQASHVIPVIYPVTSVHTANGPHLNYGTSGYQQPVCLVAFLDEYYFTETLSRFSTTMTDGFYLLNKDGAPLHKNFGTMDPAILTEINQYVMAETSLENSPLIIDGDTYYITSAVMKSGGLRIVHVFSNSTIMNSLRPMLFFLILIWILGIFVSCLISFVIARFLTRPFYRLTRVINQINQNHYHEKEVFSYTDESGLLGKQINHMYDTIQQQILLIKEEEQQKAKAEIQMYAEQINPHFLYNTLECIHFQMLNDNKESACLMLNSLGKYLRLTLNHGQTTILLEKEIEHVTEYMTIINRHSASSRIQFTCHCDDALLSLHILKLLLQPIVENAIKHGFPQDFSSYMLPPAIMVEIKKVENFLLLAVTDNGQGFDVHYAKSCMKDFSFEGGRHFGLRNVYKRLLAYYGEDADILFLSVPYYMNTITIKLPWRQE